MTKATAKQEAPAFAPPWGTTSAAVEGDQSLAVRNPFDATQPQIPVVEPTFTPNPLPPGTEPEKPSDPPPSREELLDSLPPVDTQVLNDNAFLNMLHDGSLGRKKDVVMPDSALSRNPFKPTPKAKAAPAVDPGNLGLIPRPEGTPSWSEFAQFIMKHGDKIIAAKYPHPYGEIVDTLWRGVPVTHDDQCTEVRHIEAGWVGWDLAKDDE